MSEQRGSHDKSYLIIRINKKVIGYGLLILFCFSLLYFSIPGNSPQSAFASRSRQLRGWHAELLAIELGKLLNSMEENLWFGSDNHLVRSLDMASLTTSVQFGTYIGFRRENDSHQMHELLELRKLKGTLTEDDIFAIEEYTHLIREMEQILADITRLSRSWNPFRSLDIQPVAELSAELNRLSRFFVLENRIPQEVGEPSGLRQRILGILELETADFSIYENQSVTVEVDGVEIASLDYDSYTGDILSISVFPEGTVTRAYAEARIREYVRKILGPDFTVEIEYTPRDGMLFTYYYKGIEITGYRAAKGGVTYPRDGEIVVSLPRVTARNTIGDVDVEPRISFEEAREIYKSTTPIPIGSPHFYSEPGSELVIIQSAITGEFVLAYYVGTSRAGRGYVNAITGDLEISQGTFQPRGGGPVFGSPSWEPKRRMFSRWR